MYYNYTIPESFPKVWSYPHMKREPTFQEWKEIGDKAKQIRKNLHELLNLLSGKLPKTHYMDKWRTAEKTFEKLRSRLDDIVCEKFIDMSNKTIVNIFYGEDEKNNHPNIFK